MTNYESKKLRREELRKNKELQKFVEDTKQHIMTTRFNQATWSENVAFRQRHNKFGCIYGTPEQNNSKFNDDSILFVLEMNNETNKIMGIGMIKNITHVKKYRIYNDDNYNRYAYTGKYRIDREEVKEDDEFIFRVFDQVCFNGSVTKNDYEASSPSPSTCFSRWKIQKHWFSGLHQKDVQTKNYRSHTEII